ncbi:MAG: hypothetical protein HQL51_12300 [Magnetococcales bacterium]|nr:hypothetical protein [Magnetococcales bacterium]
MNDAHTMVHSIIQHFVAAALGVFLSGAAQAGEIPNVPHPEFWGAELPVMPNMDYISIVTIYYDQNNDLNIRYFFGPDAEQDRRQAKRRQPYIESVDRSINLYSGKINWDDKILARRGGEGEDVESKRTRIIEGRDLRRVWLVPDVTERSDANKREYYVDSIIGNDWCILPEDYSLRRMSNQGEQIFNVMVFKRLPTRKMFYMEHGKSCGFLDREKIGRVRNMVLYPTLYDMEDGTMLYAPNRTPYLIRFHGKFESPFLDQHPSLVSVDADLIKKLVLAEEERLNDLRREKGGKINVLEKIDDMLSNLFKPMFEKKGTKP